MATRGDYQIGANLTGLGPDDPDANFYENYGCGSPRNYGGYCNEEIQKLIDAQSAELDPKKRVALIARIQKQLEEEAARPVLSWRLDYFTRVAAREEHGPSPVHLQFRAVPGSVARRVGLRRGWGGCEGWSLLEPRGGRST